MSEAEHFSSVLRGEPDAEFLNRIVNENRWFALGAALLARDLTYLKDMRGVNDLRRDFALSFMVNNYRGVRPIRVQLPDSNDKRSDKFDVINSFLNKPEHKIIPRENNEFSAESIVVESVSDDIITEQFANILFLQGHKTRAIEIYKKLSLKFPEKSVYFADQINKIL